MTAKKEIKKADKKIPATPERKPEFVTVTAVRLAIRNKPSLLAEQVGEVARGKKLESFGKVKGTGIDNRSTEWHKITGGYVMADFVE